MTKILILMLLLAFPLVLFSGPIEGVYNISGWDPYEKQNYTGTAIITPDKNHVYQISWLFNDGEKYRGTGFVTGNQFNAVFSEIEPSGKLIGLQTYQISENSLEGNWVLLNKTLVGTEKLTRR